MSQPKKGKSDFSSWSDRRIAWLVGFGAVLVLLFLFRELFSGKTIFTADTIKSIPFSHWGREACFAKQGIAQWIGSLFGGMPAFGSMVATPSYPVSLLFVWGLGSWLPFFADPLAQHLFHLAWLAAGMFLLLRFQGVSRQAALLGALLVMMMTTLVGLVGAGHTIKLWTLSYIPWVWLYLEKVFKLGRGRDIAIGGLLFAMMLLDKHVQMVYYFLLGAAVYYLVRLLLERPAERVVQTFLLRGVRLLGLLLIGFLLSSFLYIQVVNYSSYSMRSSEAAAVQSGEYASAYSYPPADLVTWISPDARGYGGGGYWGSLEYTAFPLYPGVLALAFGLFGIFLAPRRLRWPLLGGGLLLLLIGFGSYTGPLWELFRNGFPYLAKFRAHMWAVAVVQIMLVVLGAHGLDRLLELPAAGPAPWWRRDWGLKLAALLILLGISSAVTSPERADQDIVRDYFTSTDSMRVMQYYAAQGRILTPVEYNNLFTSEGVVRQSLQRARLAHTGLARSLIIAGIAFGALGLYHRRKFKSGVLIALLGVLVLVDLVPTDRRALNFQSRQDLSALMRPTPVIQELLTRSQSDLFRTYPRDFYRYNELVYHNLESISGYQGATLQIIDQIYRQGNLRFRTPTGVTQLLHPNLLSLLNCRYLITNEEIPGFSTVLQSGEQLLLENPTSLPRVHFPARLELLPLSEQLDRILTTSFVPGEDLLLADDPGLLPQPGEHTARFISREEERMVLEVTNSVPTLMVLSEIYYPAGWQATIDGEAVEILRANWALRALPLRTAGTHQVVLEFKPRDYLIGKWISIITLLLVLVYLGVDVMKRKRHHGEHEAQ